MSEEGDYLDLADFTGLLIDNTLSALVKSLEGQLQWREQITALDYMNDDEVFDGLDNDDIDDWITEFSSDLPAIFKKWAELGPHQSVRLAQKPELFSALKQVFDELTVDAPEHFTEKKLLIGSDYQPTIKAIKSHLTTSARRRLAMMKEMGLPALVADRVEIKSKMNLVSTRVKTDNTTPSLSPAPQVAAKPAQKKSKQVTITDKVLTRDRLAELKMLESTYHLARPVKAKIVGKLADLERIRERIPATKTHSIKIAASSTAQSSDSQHVNAEVTIVLRSHFF